MAAGRSRTGEQESFEVLKDRVRAWWATVLDGQVDEPYPVTGCEIKAQLDGDTLVITGKVPTAEDKRAVEREVERLRGRGLVRVRNELTVRDEGAERKGLLTQTLLATFDSEEQAGFARGYLEGHAHVKGRALAIVAPGSAAPRTIQSLLPPAYQEDGERALHAGKTLLVVTVDETDAFRVRQALAEETRSLETIVLPPEPANAAANGATEKVIHAG